MNQFIPPIGRPFGRRPKLPEFYSVQCTKCDWKESLELDPCEMITIPAPGQTEPSGPRQVTKLPQKCPQCGARLVKHKLPIEVKT